MVYYCCRCRAGRSIGCADDMDGRMTLPVPAVLGRMAESQINMTPECLVCWDIFGKLGNVTENRIPTAFYEIRNQAETGARCNSQSY